MLSLHGDQLRYGEYVSTKNKWTFLVVFLCVCFFIMWSLLCLSISGWPANVDGYTTYSAFVSRMCVHSSDLSDYRKWVNWFVVFVVVFFWGGRGVITDNCYTQRWHIGPSCISQGPASPRVGGAGCKIWYLQIIPAVRPSSHTHLTLFDPM